MAHGVPPQFARANIAAGLNPPTAAEDLALGQLVEVTVIDGPADGRYTVRINGQLRSASSSTELQRGTTVLAVVTGVGRRLELRAVTQAEDPAVAQALAALAARYRVELSAPAQRQIVMAAGAAESALDTLRAGIYLSKVNAEVTPAALSALVAAQSSPPVIEPSVGNRGAMVVTQSVPTGQAGSAVLGQLIERVLGKDGADLGAEVGAGFGDDSDHRQARYQGQQHPECADAAPAGRAQAQQLLSRSDGGALTYRYATLPLLVAGRLVELDMALFQHKPSASASPGRLVARLNTRRLGTVRILAQSLRSNLSISLASTTERGVTLLTSALDPLRERLEMLGWRVDRMRCDLAADIASAGREIIDHVLSSGSLDRTL